MEGKQAVGILGVVLIGVVVIIVLQMAGNNSTSKPNLDLKFPSQNQVAVPSSAPITDLRIEDLKEGTGSAVQSGDTITVNYKGTLLDGTKFDSSYDRKQSFTTQIGVGQVIRGWDQGLLGMKVGGVRKLTIPPSMGYGNQQAGSIPPNSVLIFEVELLNDQPPTPSPSPTPSESPTPTPES